MMHCPRFPGFLVEFSSMRPVSLAVSILSVLLFLRSEFNTFPTGNQTQAGALEMARRALTI